METKTMAAILPCPEPLQSGLDYWSDFDTEDGGRKFIQNFGICLQD
jgi:hypothetical protein